MGVQRTEQSVGISKKRTQQKEGAKVKQIVIYKSRTGFTKKYAKWLAQSLNCECIPQEDVGGERLSDYDVIIFGSSFRAGNVEELKWYKETILPFEKTNVLFVTCLLYTSIEAIDKTRPITVGDNNPNGLQNANTQEFRNKVSTEMCIRDRHRPDIMSGWTR